MRVYMLVPYVVPTTMCCTRNCCLDVSADRVNAFREELWTSDYEKEVIKDKVISARWEELKHSDGQACCVAFAAKAANVSMNFIYAVSSGTAGEAAAQNSRADISVMAWFEALLPITDKMPDEDWYLLSASTKRMVHEWYLEDCDLFPGIFVRCEDDWFCKIWKRYYGDIVKLRRHCKF